MNKLPNKLKNKYKGVNKSNPAVLKINLLLELLDYSFKNTVLSTGTKNEQNFSKYVYDKLVTRLVQIFKSKLFNI